MIAGILVGRSIPVERGDDFPKVFVEDRVCGRRRRVGNVLDELELAVDVGPVDPAYRRAGSGVVDMSGTELEKVIVTTSPDFTSRIADAGEGPDSSPRPDTHV